MRALKPFGAEEVNTRHRLSVKFITDSNQASNWSRLGNRGRTYTANTKTGPEQGPDLKPEGAGVGSIKNISISDVVARVTIEDREKAARALNKKLKVDHTPDVTDKEKA